MGRVRTLAITTLLTLGLATTAFGGIATAGERLSKKEFQKEANSLCSDFEDELDALFTPVFEGLGEDEVPDPAAFEAAILEAVPLFRQLLDDIEALDGPADYDRKVDKVVDRYRGAADAIEAYPSIATTDEPEVFDKPDKTAKKLGLKKCAQND